MKSMLGRGASVARPIMLVSVCLLGSGCSLLIDPAHYKRAPETSVVDGAVHGDGSSMSDIGAPDGEVMLDVQGPEDVVAPIDTVAHDTGTRDAGEFDDEVVINIDGFATLDVNVTLDVPFDLGSPNLDTGVRDVGASVDTGVRDAGTIIDAGLRDAGSDTGTITTNDTGLGVADAMCSNPVVDYTCLTNLGARSCGELASAYVPAYDAARNVPCCTHASCAVPLNHLLFCGCTTYVVPSSAAACATAIAAEAQRCLATNPCTEVACIVSPMGVCDVNNRCARGPQVN